MQYGRMGSLSYLHAAAAYRKTISQYTQDTPIFNHNRGRPMREERGVPVNNQTPRADGYELQANVPSACRIDSRVSCGTKPAYLCTCVCCMCVSVHYCLYIEPLNRVLRRKSKSSFICFPILVRVFVHGRLVSRLPFSADFRGTIPLESFHAECVTKMRVLVGPKIVEVQMTVGSLDLVIF